MWAECGTSGFPNAWDENIANGATVERKRQRDTGAEGQVIDHGIKRLRIQQSPFEATRWVEQQPPPAPPQQPQCPLALFTASFSSRQFGVF